MICQHASTLTSLIFSEHLCYMRFCPTYFTFLTTLVELKSLGCHDLMEDDCMHLCQLVRYMTQLTRLDLRLNAPCADTVNSALENLTGLRSLDLHCRIKGRIYFCFSTLRYLTELSVSGLNFGSSPGCLVSLVDLSVNDACFDFDLTSVLSSMPHLQRLELSFVKSKLPSGVLRNLTDLKSIILNPARVDEEFYLTLASLPALTELVFSIQETEGPCMSLMHQVGQLSNLRALQIKSWKWAFNPCNFLLSASFPRLRSLKVLCPLFTAVDKASLERKFSTLNKLRLL